MAELKKNWNDGGVLTATYEGGGDGSATITSQSNEGIDREMTLTFKGGGVEVERKVTQVGLREVFGDLIVKDGGTFNVLKQ